MIRTPLKRLLFLALLLPFLAGAGMKPAQSQFLLPGLAEKGQKKKWSDELAKDRESALKSISSRDIGRHISALASKKYQGRGSGDKGGWLAAKYLATELQRVGLHFGGKSASYFQEFLVPKRRAAGEGEEMVKTANVLGFIRGVDPALQNEVVVVGAHYDHLGMKKKKVFPGADDNASGTAGVLEIAEAFTLCKVKPRRTLLFILFSAEEIGLLGSSHYANSPLFPVTSTVTMLNLDMISRNKKNELTLAGVGSSPDFQSIHRGANKKIRFKLKHTDHFLRRSDQYPFYKEKIPVLFFHTGLHGDYHRTSDVPKKVSCLKAKRVTQFAFLIAWELAHREKRPAYSPISEEGLAGRLGIFPVETDEATEVNLRLREKSGIVVKKIFPKSPAAKSRLKEGDVIISLQGKSFPEEGAVGFFETLEANMKKAGTIKLEVYRGRKKMKIKVKV